MPPEVEQLLSGGQGPSRRGGGITPNLLFSRTKREVERGVTATSRGWSTRKTWRVKDGALCSPKVMTSGGLASGVKAMSEIWHDDIQAKSV